MTNNKIDNKMDKYLVEAIAFIPSYGDYDYESRIVEAESESEAIKKFPFKYYKSINAKKIGEK